MAWYDPLGELAPNALVGVGLVIAAPIVFPVVRDVLRPAAKTMIKGYFTLQDTVTEWTAETGEHLSDLVAEARAEHTAPATADNAATETSKPQRSSSTASTRKKSQPSSSSETKTAE